MNRRTKTGSGCPDVARKIYTQDASSKYRKANSEVLKITTFFIHPKVVAENELFFFIFTPLKEGSPSSVIRCHILSFK